MTWDAHDPDPDHPPVPPPAPADPPPGPPPMICPRCAAHQLHHPMDAGHQSFYCPHLNGGTWAVRLPGDRWAINTGVTPAVHRNLVASSLAGAVRLQRDLAAAQRPRTWRDRLRSIGRRDSR